MGIDGTGMRRRAVFRLLASGGLAVGSPGCLFTAREADREEAPPSTTRLPCDAETYPGIDVAVTVTALNRADGEWRIDCRVRLHVRYGNDDVALTDVRLVGTDASGTVLETTSIGDLRWTDVPADRRYAISTCEGEYQGGRLGRSGRLAAAELPRWIGVQFRGQGFGERSVSAREYAGDGAMDDASAGDYVARPATDGPFRTTLTETRRQGTEPRSSTAVTTSAGETSTDATATVSPAATRSGRK